jgi:hypothetical protein
MLLDGNRFAPRLREIGAALAALALLAPSGPALAGEDGNLQPVGTLLLELDANTSRFRLDDGDGSPGNDPFQAIFDQKLVKTADACLAGLAPPGSAPGVAAGNAELVSLPGSGGATPWGIDEGKLALGSRLKKGTGCGQIEAGEAARLEAQSLFLADASIQVEAKQDASARVILILDDGVSQTEVGRRYLLSGRAVANPPAEVASAPAEHVSVVEGNRPDGGPDSGNNDDGFWIFEAPLHNVEVFQILANADGTQGKLSIKGGGEFPMPSANRSQWTAFAVDGFLGCGDTFSCAGNEDCTSEQGSVSGNRTDTGTGDACSALIPYELAFDGRQVMFNFVDTADQNPGITLDVAWETEAAQVPLDPTVLSYDPDGVDCEDGSCSNDGSVCQTHSDCSAGNTCVLPVTASCIPLTICEGTPIRRCSHDASLGCREDSDCGSGNTCRLADLVAPAGGFPDLVPASETTVEYGCVCEEDLLYLGPGACDGLSGDLAGSSCDDDADCGTGGTCERFGHCDDASGAQTGASCADSAECTDGTDQGSCVFGDEVGVEQCLFFVGDAFLSRGGGGDRKAR